MGCKLEELAGQNQGPRKDVVFRLAHLCLGRATHMRAGFYEIQVFTKQNLRPPMHMTLLQFLFLVPKR